MSVSNRFKLFLVVVVAVFLAGAPMASASAGLSASLEAQKTYIGVADDAVVRVTLQNTSSQDLYVLRWQTAVRGVDADIFDVRLNGKAVAYTGRIYKRAAPQATDYIRIPAGKSVAATAELSAVYDMSRTGEYTVKYRVPVQDALSGVGVKIAAAALSHIESNQVFLGVERNERENRAIAEAVAATGEMGQITGLALTPGFVSCSSSRQSSLITALSNAQTLANNSKNYLAAVPSTSRATDPAYKPWFGTYTSSRWSEIQTDYNNIYSAFSTKTFTFYCDCTDSSYAYVFANQPYKVHLCGAFWSAPSLGTDSKAGTLVHETSHFTVVAGTQDYAYGQTACRNLAISNPTNAVNNADSHEYFAEAR
jgi:peptidyl-Lys metalloendopeptidase